MELNSGPLFLRPWIWVLAGLALIGIGAVYGTIYAGIPYPDPTPAMQARWVRNTAISDGLMAGGAIIAATGLLLPIARRLLNR